MATLAFILMHLLPGDPAVVIAGPDASAEAIERLRHQLGLDRPILVQLANWLGNLARGDFGQSLMLNQGVFQSVLDRLPVTLSLALVAFAYNMDLVEVAPDYDHTGTTAILAAQILMNFLGRIFHARGKR